MRAAGADPRRWPRPVNLPEPPPIPTGGTIAPPDFVGVGVQKAGTSWWFDLLADHSQVEKPPFKELHYFDQLYGNVSDGDLRRYTAYFPRRPGQICGEWTPRYIADPWVPILLAQAAPDAKILVILRDPLDRFQSGLTHDLARGAPDSAVVVSMHIERSDYVQQLTNLYSAYDRDQVLILQYEACRADVAGELAKTQRFLGLDVEAPHNPDRQVNATTIEKPPIADHVREALVARFAAMRQPLSELAPDLDPSLWSTFDATG